MQSAISAVVGRENVASLISLLPASRVCDVSISHWLPASHVCDVLCKINSSPVFNTFYVCIIANTRYFKY